MIHQHHHHHHHHHHQHRNQHQNHHHHLICSILKIEVGGCGGGVGGEAAVPGFLFAKVAHVEFHMRIKSWGVK